MYNMTIIINNAVTRRSISISRTKIGITGQKKSQKRANKGVDCNPSGYPKRMRCKVKGHKAWHLGLTRSLFEYI